MTRHPAASRAIRVRAATVLALAVVLTAAGCGSDGAGAPPGATGLALRVATDASLRAPMIAYAKTSDDVRASLSFTGLSALSSLVTGPAGANGRPDVIVAADTTVLEALHRHGLVREPIGFGSNTLEIAFRPAGSVKAQTLDALTHRGVRIAIAAASTPLGAFTRRVIARLPARERVEILANVRSDNADSQSIIKLLLADEVDAAFVYQRDVRAANRAQHGTPAPQNTAPPALYEITLSPQLDPTASFSAAIVTTTKHADAARLFIYGLLSGPGNVAIRNAGYGGAPPN